MSNQAFQKTLTQVFLKQTGKLFFCFVLSLFIVFEAFSQSFNVENFQYTFIDPDRGDRAILTEIYYPSDSGNGNAEIAEGEFPLLVFGHGFVMVWSAYENLWTHFVPKGYVMAFPRTESGFSPSHIDFGLDIAFLAEAIQEMSDDPSSVLHGGLNGKTAVMGHSMGGGASVLAASQNNNIHALLPLAPAETTPSAIEAAALVNIPSLIFAGSSDDVTPEEVHQIPIYEALDSDSKSYVSITGGGHCYFANYNFNCFIGELGSSGNITITREEQQQTVNDFATPWLDYFLKNDCEAWQTFQDSLELSSRVTGMQFSIIQNPVIIQDGEYLFSSAATDYQWYFNDIIIEGANEQYISPTESGHYSVEVKYFNQCYYYSDPFYFETQQLYTIEFLVTDQDGQNINDAIITLNGTDNDPGHYVFNDMPPGTYNYTVNRFCYKTTEGQLLLIDSSAVEEVLLENFPGDANGDGIVNVLDVIAIIAYYTGTGNDEFCFINADVNQDGIIDVLDVIGTINIYTE